MNRQELVNELQERIDREESALDILDWLDSIGYQGGEANEPGYAEAGMLAVSTSMAKFYKDLVLQGVPNEAATRIAIAFMTNATKDK